MYVCPVCGDSLSSIGELALHFSQQYWANSMFNETSAADRKRTTRAMLTALEQCSLRLDGRDVSDLTFVAQQWAKNMPGSLATTQSLLEALVEHIPRPEMWHLVGSFPGAPSRLDLLAKAHDAVPSSLDFARDYAYVLIGAGDFTAALEVAESLVAECPKDPHALELLRIMRSPSLSA